MFNMICGIAACLLAAYAIFILLWAIPRQLTVIIALLAIQLKHMELQDGKVLDIDDV